jgi:hypothetical protein
MDMENLVIPTFAVFPPRLVIVKSVAAVLATSGNITLLI